MNNYFLYGMVIAFFVSIFLALTVGKNHAVLHWGIVFFLAMGAFIFSGADKLYPTTYGWGLDLRNFLLGTGTVFGLYTLLRFLGLNSRPLQKNR